MPLFGITDPDICIDNKPATMNKNTTDQEKMTCTRTIGFFDGFAGVRIKINKNTQKWGLIDKTGKFVIPPLYDEMFYPGGKLVDVGTINHENHKEEEDILWGIVDLDNNIRVPFEYIEPDVCFAGDLVDNGFVIKRRYDCELIEILDCNGKVIARFNDYAQWDKKRIVVKTNGKTGCISPQNKILVPCIFDKIRFYKTLAEIEYNQRTYTIDWRKLRSFTRYYWLIKTISKTCNITFENLAKRWQLSQWNNGEKFSLQIFHRHRKIIKEKFNLHITYDPETDKCCIEKIHKNEKDIIKIWLEDNHLYKHLIYPYKSLQLACTKIQFPGELKNHTGDYAAACFTEQIFWRISKWGLINKKRQLVIPPIYDEMYYWGTHVIVFKKYPQTAQDSANPGKWGIIDLNNKMIVPLKYDEMKRCDSYDSTFPAKYSGKWGVIDSIGNVIIPFEYDDIWEREDYYEAQRNEKWGILSKSGEILIPFEYDNIWVWGNNFVVHKSGKWGTISRQGEILIPLIYDNYDIIGNDDDFRAFCFGEEWFFLNQQGERVLF